MSVDDASADDLGDDRLVGARAIARFRKETERRTRHLIATGKIPTGREGRIVVASKRVLRELWARTTGRAS